MAATRGDCRGRQKAAIPASRQSALRRFDGANAARPVEFGRLWLGV
jgi:hypothetical protein